MARLIICLPILLLFALATSNTVHKGYKEKKQAIEDDRKEFDEDLLLGGDDDEDYEDWHPDELDEDTREKRYNNLVRKMDTNNDEFIDKSELVTWTLKALQNMDAREMLKDFDESDSNNDGKVSFAEHVINVYGIEEEKVEKFTTDDLTDNPEMADYNRLYNREFSKFMAADTNEDGLLNKTEFELFYNPSKEPLSTEYAIKEALNRVDTNGDGKLSKEEYLADGKIPNSLLDSETQESLESIFNDMDFNDNKFLDGKELELWIQQDNGEIAADETEHLMSEADDDEDGKLSYEEMIDAMEDFIESDATEYGYQLKHDEL